MCGSRRGKRPGSTPLRPASCGSGWTARRPCRAEAFFGLCQVFFQASTRKSARRGRPCHACSWGSAAPSTDSDTGSSPQSLQPTGCTPWAFLWLIRLTWIAHRLLKKKPHGVAQLQLQFQLKSRTEAFRCRQTVSSNLPSGPLTGKRSALPLTPISAERNYVTFFPPRCVLRISERDRQPS